MRDLRQRRFPALLWLAAAGLVLLAVPGGASAAPQPGSLQPGQAAEAVPGSTVEPSPAAEPVSSGASPVDPWAGTVELYGFLPWLDATTTVRGFEADTDLAPGQILNLLQATASARASVERERLGALVDVAYNRVGAQPSRSSRSGRFTGTSKVTSSTGVYDLALRYRFGERQAAVGRPGDWSLIPYAGVRLIQAGLDVDAAVTANGLLGGRRRFSAAGSLGRTWAQPLIGTQASLFLSPKLRLFGRADAGGFGLAGAEDLSGNAQIGLAYAIGRDASLNLSWRYQGLAWSNGADRSTGFRNDQSGVELSLSLFF